MKKNIETLGIIAGKGVFPALIINEAKIKNIPFVVVCFKDSPIQFDLAGFPHLETTLGKIGAILDFFKNHKVNHIIFAGGVPRPSLTSLNFDAMGMKWMKSLSLKAFGGDDALLKGIIQLLQKEGFVVVSPRDFLPSLVLKSGIYTQVQPSSQDVIDIKRGVEVLKSLDCADVGQACIVQEGLILGVEAIEGTAELIKRCIHLKRKQQGGVLVKCAKKQQTILADLPTIGLETIEGLKYGKFSGLVISSHTTQVLDYESVIKSCNAHEMFLQVLD